MMLREIAGWVTQPQFSAIRPKSCVDGVIPALSCESQVKV